jgi:uncharacterized membrane protein
MHMKRSIQKFALAALGLALALSGCAAGGEATPPAETGARSEANTLTRPSATPSAAPETRETVIDADLVIPLAEVGTTAQFYPAEIDGVQLEVIAVEAPDGTIRTAFNTCQVCYSSGRGYYKQEGGVLVCQNCKNRFQMSQVEVQSGGCNPVPIFDAHKTEDDESITIPQSYLREATVIFASWKTRVSS